MPTWAACEAAAHDNNTPGTEFKHQVPYMDPTIDIKGIQKFHLLYFSRIRQASRVYIDFNAYMPHVDLRIFPLETFPD